MKKYKINFFHEMHLYLICQNNQGTLGMLSAILGQQFFFECYDPVGEVMDMLALINSTANFILYFLMSSDFRMTMRKLSGVDTQTVKTTITITTKYGVGVKYSVMT